ncbi:MAG: PAS domain S-box protein [Chloroflexales bacterium]|nr:PAS domain S-box protein [Chloroflexales bacterium]
MTTEQSPHDHLAEDEAAPRAAPARSALDPAERARLEAIIAARQREIVTLHRISELGLREQPLEQILPAVVEEVSACTGFPIVAIEFYDAARQVMTFAAATGIPLSPDPAGLAVPVDQTLSGLVARSGQALTETQAQARPEYAAETLRQLGVQTFVCVPMRVTGCVIGTLALAHPETAPTDESLLRLAGSLANVIAILVARKQAEARSADTERQLRVILDKLAAGVVLMDADGRYLFVNERAAASFGLTPAEVVGKSLAEVLPPAVAQAYLERNRRFIAARDFAEYERTFDLVVGTRTFFIADQVLADAQGQGYALLSSSIDITMRTQAEAALRLSEERFAKTFYGSPVALSISRLDDSTIVAANQKFLDLYDYPEAEVIGRTTIDLHIFTSQEDCRDIVTRLLAQGSGATTEMVTRTRAGEERMVELSIETITIDGITHLLSARHDITARKQAEAALHQGLEELQRSNADLEQFAYVASHDLQEPLRAVTGMVQLLQQRYGGQLDARADEYIGLAVEAAARMQALINDLLTFSRLQRRAQPFAPITLENVLTSAQANLQVAIAESGAVITHDLLPTVRADAVQLTQLFQNLLGNALKFRAEEAPRIHVSATRRERAWCLAVRDNGIGIAPDYFERIFVIFQRLHPRRAYPGTGIGLALCKKIVEHHGGQIWVESHLGHGATFFFTIPDRSAP